MLRVHRTKQRMIVVDAKGNQDFAQGNAVVDEGMRLPRWMVF